MLHLKKWFPLLIGTLLIATYLFAYQLDNLRKNTVAFEYIFFTGFIFYAILCFTFLQKQDENPHLFFLTFSLLALPYLILIFTRPTLSDDMYRYIWDGRVQAQGISPYQYPPSADELKPLRDFSIYPYINRKDAITVYPPAAQMIYAVLWRILPDNVQWFQIIMSVGALTTGVILIYLLKEIGLSAWRAFIFIGSPLLVYETAHSAHIDGLILPFLVSAWLARIREKDTWLGILLGIATAIKFYPVVLFPFLWRHTHPKGRWQMPIAFTATITAFYIPYLLTSGSDVLGFLPDYFEESFNVSPIIAYIKTITFELGWQAKNRISILALGILSIASLWALIKPAPNGITALKRCVIPIAVVTLFSQNLFSWYMLWLLPLIAIFIQPAALRFNFLPLPRFDSWTGWWLFCGLIGLSYTFFIDWQFILLALYAQYVPLYLFLGYDLIQTYVKH